jgi:hypothetical protein
MDRNPGTAHARVSAALRDRIDALIPAHPEILTMQSPWDLFAVDGFRCDDLDPTWSQARAALDAAKTRHRPRG